MAYISSFLGSLVLSIAVVLYGRIVLGEKFKVKWTLVVVIVLLIAISFTFFSIHMEGVIKTVLILFIHVITYKVLFGINYSKAIVLSILYLLILVITETLILFFILNIIGMSSNYCYNVFAKSFSCTSIVSIGFLILVLKFKNRIKLFLSFKINENIKNVILIIITFIAVLILFYKSMLFFELNYENLTLIMLMIIFIILFLGIIFEKIKNYKLSYKYDKLWIFMKVFEEEIEKQRIFNHETKNQFLTIKSICLDSKSLDEVNDYVSDIIGEERTIMNEEYAKFRFLPANGLKGLFYFKSDEAKRMGINVSICISHNIKNSFLNKMSTKNLNNLCKLIGIYFDNAIEAALQTKDKRIGLELFLLNKNIIFIISNDFDYKELTLLNGNNLSTKDDNRGHGLLLAKSIVESSNIFETIKTITNKLYVQKLIIKNLNIEN